MSAPLPSPPRRSVGALLTRRTGFAILVISLTVPWLTLAWLVRNERTVSSPASRPAVAPTAPAVPPEQQDGREGNVHVTSGRWGRLESTRVVIEPPDEAIAFEVAVYDYTSWFFPGYTEATLDELFVRADLSPTETAYFRDASHWVIEPTLIRLDVSKAIIVGLRPATRRLLYAALAVFPENLAQHSPASFRADSSEAWFAASGLTAHTLSVVRPLLYRRGDSLLFSDFLLILSDIKTPEQRELLARTLGRSQSQMVKLRLRPETDIDAVVAYWSTLQHRRNFEPMLRSLLRQSPDATVDILHLLPPTARSLLYTYAPPPESENELQRDCHWTSLNFNLHEFDERYRDVALSFQAYRTEYATVTTEPALGDIYLFVTVDNMVVHSCVHLAGDLVFTKNGSWEGSPWVIMLLSDVMALYPADNPLTLRRIRRRI
ncbi:hypothetical protein [Synoicihabitans lomoniglobus]|uniref:Uncharacterized protein n=1 Tax=Synoicihabitans lomoniglobus TaxID=2909285 RepID=A0AAE9ZTT7_9BACT|nr:hypothetical protein [Opitutaceae bacterium LMO-M01]WED63176.1 hypothetical protein PXH66_12630 [Opitutaceae bacterium LMO-M01]